MIVRAKRRPADPVTVDLTERRVSASMILSWLECPATCWAKHVLRLRPYAVSEAISFGEVFHHLTEHFDASETKPGLPTQAWTDRTAERWSVAELKTRVLATTADRTALQNAAALAACVFPVYVDHWQNVDRRRVWVEREYEFEFPVTTRRGPVVICGRIDGVSRQKSGRFVVERKTGSTYNPDLLAETLEYNVQTMLYLLAWNTLQPADVAKGVSFDGVRRPLLRCGKKEQRREFYVRVQTTVRKEAGKYFDRFDAQVSQTRVERWRDDWLIPVLEQMQVWAANPRRRYVNPTALAGRYGASPFLRYLVSGETAGLQRKVD